VEKEISECRTVPEPSPEALLHLYCPRNQMEGHDAARPVPGCGEEGVDLLVLHQLQLRVLRREMAAVYTNSPVGRRERL
jgi:hypothetical protein